MSGAWSFNPFELDKTEIGDVFFHWYHGLQRVHHFERGMFVSIDGYLAIPSKLIIETTPFQRERLIIHKANKKYGQTS